MRTHTPAGSLLTVFGQIKESLADCNAEQLEEIARKASALAAELRKAKPSYALAIASGIKDLSYETVRNGTVSKYEGVVIIEMANGTRWRAEGFPPKGDAYSVSKDGYIEFTRL